MGSSIGDRTATHSQVDAVGTKRFDSQTGADQEVQRILLELLNQMDGFDQTTNVKVGLDFGLVPAMFFNNFGGLILLCVCVCVCVCVSG